MQTDNRSLRKHLEPLARRGNADAKALLRPPRFPRAFAYLLGWYNEFLMWHDHERRPTWADWQAWAAMMQRPVTPFDLRLLSRIHVAYCVTQQRERNARGD